MTQSDLKTLSTALAFVAVTSSNQFVESESSTPTILAVAKQIEEFCKLNSARNFEETGFYIVDDAASGKLDAEIDRHVSELRRVHNTVLPQGREALLQLYDRLQRRKSRRLQREFYVTATEEKLSDLVLRYFDEEIEDIEAQS